MWARPIVVWGIHTIAISGGLFVVVCDEMRYRAAVVAILVLFRLWFVRAAIRCAADEKFAAVVRMAAQRRGL